MHWTDKNGKTAYFEINHDYDLVWNLNLLFRRHKYGSLENKSDLSKANEIRFPICGPFIYLEIWDTSKAGKLWGYFYQTFWLDMCLLPVSTNSVFLAWVEPEGSSLSQGVISYGGRRDQDQWKDLVAWRDVPKLRRLATLILHYALVKT